MTNHARAALEGGPEELPQRVVEVPPGDEVKVLFRGGYEHFRATTRSRETSEGRLPVYEWWERTEIPG